MVTAREWLHQLIDELPEGELHAATRYLEFLRVRAGLPCVLAEAPEEKEPVTEQERAAIAEAMEDIAAGRLVSHDEARRHLLERS